MAHPDNTSRPPKPMRPNPIVGAVSTWLREHSQLGAGAATTTSSADSTAQLLAQTPKRWSAYYPLVLLPSGSFGGAEWRRRLDDAGEARARVLWAAVLSAVSAREAERGRPFTHLAVNEGIPSRLSSAPEAERPGAGEDGGGDEDNVLRRPSNLRYLHGDFGPARLADDAAGPAKADFDAAFWVSVRQHGITQTWAPRWTMFSRGNVGEKRRVLDGFGQSIASEEEAAGATERIVLRSRSSRRRVAVDLYAGIGYFAFPYAAMADRSGSRSRQPAIDQVLCWELNPWSVEALRRGAELNGWSVRVVKGEELERWDAISGKDGEEPRQGPERIGSLGETRIVVFLEDNANAERRIRMVKERGSIMELEATRDRPPQNPGEPEIYATTDGLDGEEMEIVHINCGLLPTSEASWAMSWRLVSHDGGWLHLHMNVGVKDIEETRQRIQEQFDEWSTEDALIVDTDGQSKDRRAEVRHAEMVKTFAPGVWHCVFDVLCYTRGPRG